MYSGNIRILISAQVSDGLIWDALRHADTSIVALQGDLEIVTSRHDAINDGIC